MAMTWTVDELKDLDRLMLEMTFGSLEAPKPEEIQGDFIGHLPSFIEKEWREFMASLGKNFWLGKSFTAEPLGEHQGHGHNRYSGRESQDGSVVRESRFVWDIAPSVIDGLPSLVMKYKGFKNWGAEQDLVDEVRVAAPGVLLGIYHTREPVPGFTPRPGGVRWERSNLEFFVLEKGEGDFMLAERD